MKKIILSVFVAIITNATIYAQVRRPAASPSSKIEQKVGLTDIILEYSRPAVKGRTIFGDLVPYGRIWRTGANENTKITFSTDVIVSGQTLKKGTYAIYTQPEKESWQVVFYSDANNWGSPEKWDSEKVVAKATIQVIPKAMNIETFTMSFDDLTNTSAVLGIMWGKVYVGVRFEVPTKDEMEKVISKTLEGPSYNDYIQSAIYYYNTDQDINKAKGWLDKSIEMTSKEPKIWMLYWKSLIHEKAGYRKSSVAAAKKSLRMAQKEKNNYFIKKNEEFLAKHK
tara:strand:+ start:15385 stop:16230 length:846 start_codon:yes stop_codon:yes gene_type:complete